MDWQEFNSRAADCGFTMRLRAGVIVDRSHQLVVGDRVYPPEIVGSDTPIRGEVVHHDLKTRVMKVDWPDVDGLMEYAIRAPRNVWKRERRRDEVLAWEADLLGSWEAHAAASKVSQGS